MPNRCRAPTEAAAIADLMAQIEQKARAYTDAVCQDARLAAHTLVAQGGIAMPIVERITALLDTLDSAELDRIRPTDRRAFAELCRHWAQLAERREAPKAGVVAELNKGERSD
jgi:hypothetical protein